VLLQAYATSLIAPTKKRSFYLYFLMIKIKIKRALLLFKISQVYLAKVFAIQVTFYS